MAPKICSLDDCDKRVLCKGLCSKHYTRKLRRGVTSLPSPEDRFWLHVNKSETCWRWTASTTGDGYGKFKVNGKTTLAHRFAYELAYGQIPPGRHIDHKCFTPECVRASHLHAVTPKQNNENRMGPQSGSRSGIRGVTWNEKRHKWCAAVGSNGKSYNAGRYATREEAEAAVIAKRNELFTNNLKDRKAHIG